MRAFIDMWVSVSLISEDRNKCLWLSGWFRKRDIEISQTDGKAKTILGVMSLPVKIRGKNSVHNLYVTTDLCGEMISGEERLR